MPKKNVKHTIMISYGGVGIPNSPYRVLVQEASNPSKVRVSGPAVEAPVQTFQPTHLIVDCSQAGPGRCTRLYNFDSTFVTSMPTSGEFS